VAAVVTSICPQCGAQFRCGMENGDKECWCAGLPALSPVLLKADGDPIAASCFCPACLQLRLQQTNAA
jgi:hypothetical protein